MSTRAGRLGRRQWQVASPFDGAADLARQLGTAPLVAQILHNRGVTTVEAARSFLDPKLTHLHDPALLDNIDAAANRILAAVRAKEKITLYGDYDVDGMTGVAILRACLSLLGAEVEYYIPHRLEEGYGVNVEAIEKIIADGTKLIVTIDCGISAHEPLAKAAAAGVDVIVTDHHHVGAALPPAVAVVHPQLSAGYPNSELAGAGVAFKLAWHTARLAEGAARVSDRLREFLVEAMALAALGTIADVVPLVGENRVFATYGLRSLPTTRHVGLRALLETANLVGKDVDAFHVGFVLAPRLNACGRMGHAALAVELLTTAPAQRSHEIATFLIQQNERRQQVEREIFEQACLMVESAGMNGEASMSIVLASEQWHAGVIGIVASRLVERFHRPAVLIALGPDGGQGSGRSITGFNLNDALEACRGHLVGCGGHAMAAGLRIETAKVQAFADAFAAHAAAQIKPAQLKRPLLVDAEGTLGSLGTNLARHIERLAPFGQGNPSPLVAFRNCRVVAAPRRMGKGGSTVSLLLGQNGTNVRAVGFGMGDLADDLVGVNNIDVAGEIVLNTYNGNTNVELKLKDVQLPEGA